MVQFFFLFDRQTKMDRIRRRQINARPFLRPAKFLFQENWKSNSVRFGGGERGKRHEFDVWDIHGIATGNLFLVLHGTGAISSFIICCLFISWSLFEREWNRGMLCSGVKHRRLSIKSVDPPVDAELEKRRSSLGGDYSKVNRDLFA